MSLLTGTSLQRPLYDLLNPASDQTTVTGAQTGTPPESAFSVTPSVPRTNTFGISRLFPTTTTPTVTTPTVPDITRPGPTMPTTNTGLWSASNSGFNWQDPSAIESMARQVAIQTGTPAPSAGNIQEWQRDIMADAGAHDVNYWTQRMFAKALESPSPSGFGGFSAGDLNNLFSDPAAATLMNFIMSGVAALQSRPAVDPTVQAYLTSAQDFAAQMQQPWVNPEAASTQATLHGILDQLLGPVYTDQQNAAILAQGTDQIEQDRAAAIHNTIARMSALGHGRDSGTVAQAVADVNRAYDQQRAAALRGITVQGTQQEASNRAQAAQISAQLDAITQSNEQFSTSRQQAGVSALGQAAQASTVQQQLNDSRLNQILSLLEVPVSLSDQRLSRALQILGLGGNTDPAAILNSLNAFATSANQQNALNNAQNAGFWNSLGQWVPIVMQGFG